MESEQTFILLLQAFKYIYYKPDSMNYIAIASCCGLLAYENCFLILIKYIAFCMHRSIVLLLTEKNTLRITHCWLFTCTYICF